MKKRFIIAVGLSVIFFVVGLFSLPHYGVNWDEAVHFARGWAILHYFLTGTKDYKNIPATQKRSYYQYDSYTYAYFESNFIDYSKGIPGAGHPPLSDIGAALSNYLFYQKLGILGDTESFHLYSVILASVLIFIIFYVVSSFYGEFSGIVATLSLALYPLFLGELRFNTKDAPEVVFYSLTLICVFWWIKSRKHRWLIISAILFGFAFSTKINILFAGVTFGLWLMIRAFFLRSQKPLSSFITAGKILGVYGVVCTIISLLIYFASWPILWGDPWNRFLYNMVYYQKIGTESVLQYPQYLFFNINTYASQWVLYTTPLIILFLFIVGVWYTLKEERKESHQFAWFVFLWFLVPILRVSLPKAAIYGGVRQIMEYIPAMAILSGIGARYIVEKYKHYSFIFRILIIFSFLPITLKMISIHPYESVYFNPLIGGLAGAKERNIPGWGNSLGSTYLQGVRWLNAHAEPNAKLALVYELRSNISGYYVRSDIEFANRLRSVIRREGEYLIGVTHEGTYENTYNRLYLERYLNPVYQVVVDGIPLLKIWKNDLEHTKDDYKKEEQILENFTVSKDERRVVIDLGSSAKLTRIHVEFDNSNCTSPTNGYFEYATDNPPHWQRVSGDFKVFPFATWFKVQPSPGILDYLFAAQDARYLQMVTYDNNSCLLTKPLTIQLFHI